MPDTFRRRTRGHRGRERRRGCGVGRRRAGPSRIGAGADHRRARDRGAGCMTVHFIGAGPGAADLLTLRGRDILGRCPVCLYAGSLVSAELLTYCAPGAKIVDTAPMTLDLIEAEFFGGRSGGARRRAPAFGRPVDLQRGGRADAAARPARHLVHRDARRPRLRRRRRHAARVELTVPEVAQSVVLTRVGGRASAMPSRTSLSTAFAANRGDARDSSRHSRASRDRRDAVALRTARTARWPSWCARAGRTSGLLHGTLGTIHGGRRRTAGRTNRDDFRRPRAGGGGVS